MIQVVTYVYARGRLPAFHSQANIDLSVQLLVCICDLFVAVGRPGSAALPIGPDSLHHIFCVFKGPQKTIVAVGS
jgi:hypothetical protein